MRIPVLSIIILSVFVAGGIWLYMGMFASYGDYGTVRRTACMSNLKQIARAAVLYAEDYDRTLMPSATWMDRLTTAYRNSKGIRKEALIPKEHLRCPCIVEKMQSESNFGYAYNSNLSAAQIDEIELPEHTPLAYESKNWAWNASDTMTSFPGPVDPEIPESSRANLVSLAGILERPVKGE